MRTIIYNNSPFFVDVRVGDKKSELSNFELKRTKLISPKSMPNFWKRVSEELYYTSNALTVCMRRSQSLTKCQNVAVCVFNVL